MPPGAPVDLSIMDSKEKRLVAIEGILNGSATFSYDCFAIGETYKFKLDGLSKIATVLLRGKYVQLNAL